MILIYEESSKELVDLTGYKGLQNGKIIDQLEVPSLPSNLSYLQIYDLQVIANIWEAYDTRGEITLIFDEEGNFERVETTVGDYVPTPDPEPLDPIEELELNLYEALAEVYEEQITAQLDAYEATAAVYEEQMISLLNTYEAIAEMYELILGGGEANV
ncbi:hypothetical protein [Halalkalibacter oceani]|uniref:hypothetical protein n=1 Tax=Halalkalibacter oceani TaxID=1653776 RepID=UPI003397F0E8